MCQVFHHIDDPGFSGFHQSMVTVPRFEEAAGRVVPRRFHDGAGAALVVAVGLSSLLFHLVRLTRDIREPFALLFGVVIPLVLSVLLCVVGASMIGIGYDGLKLRIGVWCLVGVALLVGISLITVRYQAARGIVLPDVGVVVSASATGGGVVGLLIGIYDAERKQTERRMAAERETARRLGRRLSVLNRVLRHDIRNDVTVIRGNAERILDGADSEEPARAIKRKASKLHRLSESAREIESLIERDGVATEPIDVAAVLDSEARDLRRSPGVAVETSIPEAAWASASSKIGIAIGHVVENAVEHNDADDPRVEIEADVDGGNVILRIADNGPGFPESEIRVLERGHETDVEHASGLGLWLANWIVTDSGGSITFERGDPRGSVVIIGLPRADPPE
jgi:signal transduction histidine kinase